MRMEWSGIGRADVIRGVLAMHGDVDWPVAWSRRVGSEMEMVCWLLPSMMVLLAVR